MTAIERVRLSAQSSGLCRIEMLQPELSLEMLNDLLLVFDKARQLNDVKAVVLAARRVTSPSDHDLRLLLQKERLLADYMEQGRALGRAMRDFRVPFGVCVSRAAEGIGLELLLQAPSVVLGEEARVIAGGYSLNAGPPAGGGMPGGIGGGGHLKAGTRQRGRLTTGRKDRATQGSTGREQRFRRG